MSRTEYTFTFSNAQPGSGVLFSDPVYADATTTTRSGDRLTLDHNGTVAVWCDAAYLVATTTDGAGLTINATATRANPTVTDTDGTAGVNPFAPAPATTVTYDNTDSGLTATDVQAALDEIVTRIVALETP
jgi:hypothetical protein